ncbi:MCP four helix bundle domain-containing protein [Massilia sp. CMS3.1]|uniref:MCP four helix bundle domain-containing protein n=1 Tax=Massilia sp. CMS3.1 TaxID=3373083 RepID=UPI003EE45FAF
METKLFLINQFFSKDSLVMKNINIGTRLALGFAIVFSLLIALITIAVIRMSLASSMTDELVHVKVRDERLIQEWQRVIEVNAVRTSTAWLATDLKKQTDIEAQIKVSSARATQIQEKLVEVLQEPLAKSQLEKVLATRSAYVAARAKVFSAKASGDMALAEQTYRAPRKTPPNLA